MFVLLNNTIHHCICLNDWPCCNVKGISRIIQGVHNFSLMQYVYAFIAKLWYIEIINASIFHCLFAIISWLYWPSFVLTNHTFHRKWHRKKYFQWQLSYFIKYVIWRIGTQVKIKMISMKYSRKCVRPVMLPMSIKSKLHGRWLSFV